MAPDLLCLQFHLYHLAHLHYCILKSNWSIFFRIICEFLFKILFLFFFVFFFCHQASYSLQNKYITDYTISSNTENGRRKKKDMMAICMCNDGSNMCIM